MAEIHVDVDAAQDAYMACVDKTWDSREQPKTSKPTCIFTVPKTLIRGQKDKETAVASYTPQIVCLGAFHSLTSDKFMEQNKSEVVRAVFSEEDFREIIARIAARDVLQELKECYGKFGTKLRDGVLSWMLARDAIFILQFLRQRVLPPEIQFSTESHTDLTLCFMSKCKRQSKNLDRPLRISTGEIESLPLAETLTDIVKLENQIPASVLRFALDVENEMLIKKPPEELVKNEMFIERVTKEVKSPPKDPQGEQTEAVSNGIEKAAKVSYWIKARKEALINAELQYMLARTCRHLSPIVKADPDLPKNWSDNSGHILQCLRHYVVSKGEAQEGLYDRVRHGSIINLVLQPLKLVFQGILYVVMFCFISRRKNADEAILKCAVELERAGINFKASVDGIEGIRFNEISCTLHLPRVNVDPQTEAIMRNMMAFELCYSEFLIDRNAVTRYAHFMDQLIDTEKDVEILRECGIISHNLPSDSKVADFWNSLSDSTWTPSYGPIDDATAKIMKYYRKGTTSAYILWKEFIEEYCSKPWHIAALVISGGLAAMTLLELNCSYRFLGWPTCAKT